MTNQGKRTAKIGELAEYFLHTFQQDPYQQYPSLYGGRGSSVLIQYLFYRYEDNEAFLRTIESGIDRIMEYISSEEDLLAGFCNGLAGIGWLFLFLNERRIIEIDPDEFLQDIDEHLDIILKVMLENEEFDLMHGALGLGIYFLKRGDIRKVESIILELSRVGNTEKGERKWRRHPINALDPDMYDIGLGHGQAGIIYFLGKCYNQHVMPDLCHRMITESIRFLFNNLQSIESTGSFFPNAIPADRYDRGEANMEEKSRLAWCYGDLGILHTLLLVSIWMHDSSLKSRIEELLMRCAERRNLEDNLVLDAQFCHGASGIGYIYHSAFKLTGNPVFKEAADYWQHICLEMGNEVTIDCGFLFYNEENKDSTADLLTGTGGVAAFLMTYENDELLHTWDDCLFLS